MAEDSGIYNINPLKSERPPEVNPDDETVGQTIGRYAGYAAMPLQGIADIVGGVASIPVNAAKTTYDVLTNPASKTGDILTSPTQWNTGGTTDQVQPGTDQGAPKQDPMSYFAGPMNLLSEADKNTLESQMMVRYGTAIPTTQGIQEQEEAAKGAYDILNKPNAEGLTPTQEAAQSKEDLAAENQQKIKDLEQQAGIKFKDTQAAADTWAKEVDTINKKYPALTYQEASNQLSTSTRFFSSLGRVLLGKFGRELIPSVEEQIRNKQADNDKLFERDINVLAQKEKATLDDVQVAMNRRVQMSDASAKTYDAGIELTNAHLGTELAPLEALKAKGALGVVTDARERAVAARNQAVLNLQDVTRGQIFQNDHNPLAVPVGTAKDGTPQYIVGYTEDDTKQIAQMTPKFKAMQDNINNLMDMINKRRASTNAEKEGAYDLLKAQAQELGVGRATELPKTFTGYIYDDSKVVESLAKALQTYQNAFYMSRGHQPYLDKRLLNIITKPKGPSASTYATSVTGG